MPDTWTPQAGWISSDTWRRIRNKRNSTGNVASFRNHGAFHQDRAAAIGKRISAEIKPKWLRIGGYWYPRGGIPIDVFWQTGKLPKGMWIPDQGVAPYRGRG